VITPTVGAAIKPLTSTVTVAAFMVPTVGAATPPLTSTVIEPDGLLDEVATLRLETEIAAIASLAVTVMDLPAPTVMLPV